MHGVGLCELRQPRIAARRSPSAGQYRSCSSGPRFARRHLPIPLDPCVALASAPPGGDQNSNRQPPAIAQPKFDKLKKPVRTLDGTGVTTTGRRWQGRPHLGRTADPRPHTAGGGQATPPHQDRRVPLPPPPPQQQQPSPRLQGHIHENGSAVGVGSSASETDDDVQRSRARAPFNNSSRSDVFADGLTGADAVPSAAAAHKASIRIASSTNVKDAAASVAHALRARSEIALFSVGDACTVKAVKALATARKLLRTRGPPGPLTDLAAAPLIRSPGVNEWLQPFMLEVYRTRPRPMELQQTPPPPPPQQQQQLLQRPEAMERRQQQQLLVYPTSSASRIQSALLRLVDVDGGAVLVPAGVKGVALAIRVIAAARKQLLQQQEQQQAQRRRHQPAQLGADSGPTMQQDLYFIPKWRKALTPRGELVMALLLQVFVEDGHSTLPRL